MILPIYLYGSDVLRKENADADITDRETVGKLVDDMWEIGRASCRERG